MAQIISVVPIGVTVRQGKARVRKELKYPRVELYFTDRMFWIEYCMNRENGRYCVSGNIPEGKVVGLIGCLRRLQLKWIVWN